MKEYRILREIQAEPPIANQVPLEDRINGFARDGWVVKSFGVGPAPAPAGHMPGALICALLERDGADAVPIEQPASA